MLEILKNLIIFYLFSWNFMKQDHYMTHLLCNVPLSCVIQPLLNPPLCSSAYTKPVHTYLKRSSGAQWVISSTKRCSPHVIAFTKIQYWLHLLYMLVKRVFSVRFLFPWVHHIRRLVYNLTIPTFAHLLLKKKLFFIYERLLTTPILRFLKNLSSY
jgi:hypothetical protein